MSFKSQCDIFIIILVIYNASAFSDNACVVEFEISSKEEKAIIDLGKLCKCLGYDDATLFFNDHLDQHLLDIGVHFNSEGALQISHLEKVCSKRVLAGASAEEDENTLYDKMTDKPEIETILPKNAKLDILHSKLARISNETENFGNSDTDSTEEYEFSKEFSTRKPKVLFGTTLPTFLTHNNISQSDETKLTSAKPTIESLMSYTTEYLFTTSPFAIGDSEPTTNVYDLTRIDIILQEGPASKPVTEKQQIDIYTTMFTTVTDNQNTEKTTQSALVDILTPNNLNQTEEESSGSTESIAKDIVDLSTLAFLPIEDASSTLNEVTSTETPTYATSFTLNEVTSTETTTYFTSSTLNEVTSTETPTYDTSATLNEVTSTETPTYVTFSTFNEVTSTETPTYDTFSTLNEVTSTETPTYVTSSTFNEVTSTQTPPYTTSSTFNKVTSTETPTDVTSPTFNEVTSDIPTPIYNILPMLRPQELKIKNDTILKETVTEKASNSGTTQITDTSRNDVTVDSKLTPTSTISTVKTNIASVQPSTKLSLSDIERKCTEFAKNNQHCISGYCSNNDLCVYHKCLMRHGKEVPFSIKLKCS